ncbi:MAG: hypothetical protein ACLR5H_06875 [Oscillospiraceae bacterium]
MRPKLTNRTNADGDLIYTYMCSTKERSHGSVCAMKNCNGNTLDAKIIEEIRKLSADKETLSKLLGADQKGHQRQQGGLRRGAGTAERKAHRNGRSYQAVWWSPCPLPATPLRSTSWSRSTRSIRRARHSSCASPSWKPSPNRAGCCIRSSPSIRK